MVFGKIAVSMQEWEIGFISCANAVYEALVTWSAVDRLKWTLPGLRSKVCSNQFVMSDLEMDECGYTHDIGFLFQDSLIVVFGKCIKTIF